MVGHTHEDIDQMFSCFSRHLSKRDARTLPELTAEMAKAYTPEPSNILLDCMFDVKKWMDGHIEQQVSGHINQHQFKFISCNGEAVTFYKKWSTSPKWLPCSLPDKTSGLTLVHSLPTGVPEIITPNCDKIPLAKLKQDIGKLTAKFDKATEIWWEKCLNDLENLTTRKEIWFLEQMKKIEESLPVQQDDVTDEETRISKQIETLMEKETTETEVLYICFLCIYIYPAYVYDVLKLTRRLQRRSLRLPTRSKSAQTGHLCTTATAQAGADPGIFVYRSKFPGLKVGRGS